MKQLLTDVLADVWQWIVATEAWEWIFSGVGIPLAGLLWLRFRRKPSALPNLTPPASNTFMHNGSGEQNIAQGKGAVGKKVKHINASGASIGVLGKNAHVEGGIHHHYYDRTEQGIPLQRPKQADYLVGRQKLLKDVLAALQPGKVVTLCGPGGIGKTALASRVAWELAPEREAPALFPDGLLFSSFYGRKDVSLAFDHLVRSYSDDAQDNSPEAVCRLLANKQALIILDGAEEADDLPAVLRCCGGCGVLITSRKRSDAPGKLLEVKALDKLPAEEAFRLYSRGTARCAPTTTDEATVRAVCKRLGGWPLALRLAGHYLRNTGESATDYLRWLEKEPFKELGDGKHQDENAALLLRRSVEQVSEDAKFALNIIGALALAPFTERPIVALLKINNFNTPWQFYRLLKNTIAHRKTWLVHSTDEDIRFCRKVLNELVVFGLLERQGQRWQVSHALIHTYARKKMPLNRWLLKGLARFYIVFAREQSEAGLEGYARLDEERVHCLRLIESCLERELWQEVQLLVREINTYLDRQGHWTEQLSAVEMNLTAARKTGDRMVEGWCLNALGYTCTRRGEYDKAHAWYEQCLPIRRELEDRLGEGVTLNNMAAIYRQQGRYEPALQTYQQSLSIRQEVGDREGEGATLNNIGMLYRAQGDNEQALQQYEQSLPIMREVGDKIGEGGTLNNIASIYHAQGKLGKALEYRKQSLAIRRVLGDLAGEAVTCWSIGTTYEDLGELAQADEYMTLAVEIEEKIGHPDLENDRNYLEQVQAKR
ncbi:MAG: tetratricopeptide repeat protein [Candidatus Electrothrix sp. Rat3]|nr:tetratricopeptide repeat protein [Candidatus Electrothrix rattekaaiensis]